MWSRARYIPIEHPGQEQQAGVALVQAERRPLEWQEHAVPQGVIEWRASQLALQFRFRERGLLEALGSTTIWQLPRVELRLARLAVGFTIVPLAELTFAQASELGDGHRRTPPDAAACQD